MAERPTVVCALKWAARSVNVDALSGAAAIDERANGISPADEAALEIVLIAADRGARTIAVTVGPPPAVSVLREALACGVERAIHIVTDDAGDDLGIPSAHVARELAGVCAGAALIVCGDYSVDRGSGSVPALLAHELGIAQALGLVSVSFDDGVLRLERRLDGGRREQLAVDGPAVISVEPHVAKLRRASVGGMLAAHTTKVATRDARGSHVGLRIERRAYRPRTKYVEPPQQGASALERVAAVTGLDAHHEPPVVVELDAQSAAAMIVAKLDEWSTGE